jgi:NitT/TauT family transport system permease protein
MTKLLPIGVLLTLTAAWWWAASGSAIFPTPPEVLQGMVQLAEDGTLLRHVSASLYRVTFGYGVAVLLAVPFGILMGWYRPVFTAFNPVVQMLRPISPIAWIPLAILWFGVGDLSPTFLVFQASFFPVVVATISGVQQVGREYIRAAQNFGITGFKLFRTIIVPGALPTIITGMRVGLGVGWLVVVAAEMVGITSGLGYLIIDSRNAGMRYDLVVAGMIIIGTIGLFLDLLMRRLETLKEVRWRYVSGG